MKLKKGSKSPFKKACDGLMEGFTTTSYKFI